MEKGISSARSSRRGHPSVGSASTAAEAISVGAGAPRASSEAVAAEDIEDDVEDGDDDLFRSRMSAQLNL